MNQHNILFIGLDTHKDFHEVAYIEEQRGAQPVHLRRISSSKIALTKLAKTLASKYPDATLHFAYEAGPCGYWIYRHLTSLGYCCYVIAPSLIPKKSGDKVKTDRKDAIKLAKLLKSEDLTPIYVPEPEDEAVRDLARAREQRMSRQGKHYNLIIIAIAREMIAYIWAIAKEVVLTPVNPTLRLARVPA